MKWEVSHAAVEAARSSACIAGCGDSGGIGLVLLRVSESPNASRATAIGGSHPDCSWTRHILL